MDNKDERKYFYGGALFAIGVISATRYMKLRKQRKALRKWQEAVNQYIVDVEFTRIVNEEF
jgi:hypothetical protein